MSGIGGCCGVYFHQNLWRIRRNSGGTHLFRYPAASFCLSRCSFRPFGPFETGASRSINNVKICYSTMRHVQVGIVGAGDITGLVHLPVLKNYGDVHIAWIADLDAQRVRALGRVFEIDGQIVLRREKEIQLPSCDIALLATPVYARRPYLEYFSARGNAVLTEKPFSLSVDEHQSFLRLCANIQI